MTDTQLPSGWTWITPADVAANERHSLAIGPFGSNLRVSDYRDSGVPLVFVRNIRASKFGGDDVPHVSPEKAVELRSHSIRGDDILITKMGDPPGDSTVYPTHCPPAVITADCIKWRVDPSRAIPWFFAYAVRTHAARQQFATMTKGVAQKKVSLERFRAMRLPMAPLPEQKTIVAAIDSHFSRLDAATAALERVQRNLERYRASVLKAAVEGRLVPTEAELARKEGRSYEPASVLLKRILAERRRRWEEAELAKLKSKGRSPTDDRWKARYEEPVAPDTDGLPELPEGWCWASVDQVTVGDRMCAYGVLVPGPDVLDGVPLVRVGDIDDGRVRVTELKQITRAIADRFSKTYLRGGEVLLTLVGTIGRVAVVPRALAGANVARAVGVIPTSDHVDPTWVCAWFRSPEMHARMVGKSHEVARKTLNLEDVRVAAVALPPQAEQTRIVERVSDLDSLAGSAQRTADAALKRICRLRQSILAWAFDGRLVDGESRATRLDARARIGKNATDAPSARR